ncbi:hypothetical protein AB837_00582 [bacterium AB1]|nr:hypothetical protein AB837_00582 [bacterium AB1]
MVLDPNQFQKNEIIACYDKIKKLCDEKKDEFIEKDKDLYSKIDICFSATREDILCSTFGATISEGKCSTNEQGEIMVDGLSVTSMYEALQQASHSCDINVENEDLQRYCLDFMAYLMTNNVDNITMNYICKRSLFNKFYLNSILSALNHAYLDLSMSGLLCDIHYVHKIISGLQNQIRQSYINHVKKIINYFEKTLSPLLITKYIEHQKLQYELLSNIQAASLEIDKLEYNSRQNKTTKDHFNNIIQILQTICTKKHYLLHEERNGFLFVDGDEIIHSDDHNYNEYLSFIQKDYKNAFMHKSKKIEIYCFSLNSCINYVEILNALIININHLSKKPLNGKAKSLYNLLLEHSEECEKKMETNLQSYKEHLFKTLAQDNYDEISDKEEDCELTPTLQ